MGNFFIIWSNISLSLFNQILHMDMAHQTFQFKHYYPSTVHKLHVKCSTVTITTYYDQCYSFPPYDFLNHFLQFEKSRLKLSFITEVYN